MDACTSTFCDLKFKDVINICDGRRLGRIIDIVLDLKCGVIKGLVLPGTKNFSLFKPAEDIFVPWKYILRIGEDVILVELKARGGSGRGKGSCGAPPPRPPRGRARAVLASAAAEDGDDDDYDEEEDGNDDVAARILGDDQDEK